MGTGAHFIFGRRVAGQRFAAVAAQPTLNGGSLGLHGPLRGVVRSPFDKAGAPSYLGWSESETLSQSRRREGEKPVAAFSHTLGEPERA